MPELRINPDKVCQLMEAARELAGRVPSTAGDHTTTGDDSPLTFIEQSDDDPTRAQIIEHVWDWHFDTGTNFVEVYIQRLRRKIDDAHDVKLLHTVRGVGYVLRP